MSLSLGRNQSFKSSPPRRNRVNAMLLWLGLFGAPVAWVAQVFLSEPLAAYACYPYQTPLSAPLWERLSAMLVTIGIACLSVALLSGLVAWALWRQSECELAGEERSTINNTVDWSNTKPSPEGEGWVRGNQNKEKSLFKSPHPNLLPQGEGAQALKSTVSSVTEAGEGRNRFLAKLSAMSSFIFTVAIIFNICAVVLVSPCSSWF